MVDFNMLKSMNSQAYDIMMTLGDKILLDNDMEELFNYLRSCIRYRGLRIDPVSTDFRSGKLLNNKTLNRYIAEYVFDFFVYCKELRMSKGISTSAIFHPDDLFAIPTTIFYVKPFYKFFRIREIIEKNNWLRDDIRNLLATLLFVGNGIAVSSAIVDSNKFDIKFNTKFNDLCGMYEEFASDRFRSITIAVSLSNDRVFNSVMNNLYFLYNKEYRSRDKDYRAIAMREALTTLEVISEKPLMTKLPLTLTMDFTFHESFEKLLTVYNVVFNIFYLFNDLVQIYGRKSEEEFINLLIMLKQRIIDEIDVVFRLIANINLNIRYPFLEFIIAGGGWK